MKKMLIKIALVALVVFILLAVAGGLYLNWMMKQPLYHLGDVAAEKNLRGPLVPPEQTDPSVWKVEDDIRLSFKAHGDGEPVLIVHGGPGIPYASAWKALDKLTDRYKFYYYHQRGCGKSTRPFTTFESKNYYQNMKTLEKTLGLGAQIADIERIRQILGREKLTIIGHSYGGFIATLYAAEFPDRVNKLILVAPAGVLTPPDDQRNLFDLAREKLTEDEKEPYDKVVKEYFDFGKIFSKSDEELADLHMRLGHYLVGAMGYSTEDIEAGAKCGGWTVFALYFSNGRAQDYREALTQVTAPTLILVGEDDHLAMAGSETYQPIKDSKFVKIKRDEQKTPAGHFVYDDSPQTFGQTVEEFLSSKSK